MKQDRVRVSVSKTVHEKLKRLAAEKGVTIPAVIALLIDSKK